MSYTVRKKANPQKAIKSVVDELKKYNPGLIVLFGSRARGDNRVSSDIDLAVDLKLDFRQKRKLLEKLELLSGLYSVDLVFLPELNEEFRDKILKEGKVLYERGRSLNENSEF